VRSPEIHESEYAACHQEPKGQEHNRPVAIGFAHLASMLTRSSDFFHIHLAT
jgi:hypothetical protein